MAKKRKSHRFDVLLDVDELQQLRELGEATGLKGADILRQAIKWRWEMEFEGAAKCASGMKCFVPAMHMQGTPKNGHQRGTEIPALS